MPVLLVETVPIAPLLNLARTTRRPTDVDRTRILGPAKEQRSWVFLLNHDVGGGPSPERRMTAFHRNKSSKTSPYIRTTADLLRNIRAMYLTPLLILIPILTLRLMAMMLHRDRLRTIYDPKQILCCQLNHSATMGGTLPQTPTCTSLQLPTPLLTQHRRRPTSTTIPQLFLGRP